MVEIVTHCPTTYGRRNKIPDAVSMLKLQKDMAVYIDKAGEMKPQELEGKRAYIPINNK